jgi:DNA polymerase III subunit alpha
MIVNLHTHSNFSFLEGLASPTELVEAAARFEMPALALTDHSRLSGSIEFYQACQQAGIKPILGMELDVQLPASAVTAGAGAILLLAEDLKGWTSLCRLASTAQGNASGGLELSIDQLPQNAAGLICLTGGARGPLLALTDGRSDASLDSVLARLSEIYPGRLFVQLQIQSERDLARVDRLAQAARRMSLPTVAAQSIYYISPDQAALQQTLAAIRLNVPLEKIDERLAAPPSSHFVSPDEICQRFADYPHALEATLEIAERCRLELPLGKAHFPTIELPPGLTPIQLLRKKAEQGAARLYGPDSEVRLRLVHELEVIQQCGYEALFLVMEEIVDFAHQSGIPIASRGSASSSLVAHCLGITTPDPIRLDLFFERFLNPARLTPPDIDTDLCSRRRDEVIRFVYRRFGEDRVAMVCTINRFRRRSALRETAKAHGLSSTQVSELADGLPHRWYGPPDRFLPEEQPYAGLEARFNSALHRQIFAHAAAMIGLPRHLSIHPGGIVISPSEMTDLVPTQMAAKGVLITQFDLESIERLGLVKIDLLGIRGLTVLGDVAQEIANSDSSGKSAGPFSEKGFSRRAASKSAALQHLRRGMEMLDSIPRADPATADTVEAGRTIGCFQIESPGMRATLKEIRARTVDDVMVALALYRPGPLTGGLKDAFVDRYRGLKPADYLHPALEPLLSETFGVILYQEQVLRIAHALGGFSLAEADLLRRAMSHFDPGKQMQSLKERFILNAFQTSGVPQANGERIWELMVAFAGYGFPKAHAASYAQVAWQSAWCKTHHPALFLAAVLANWGGYYSQQVYLTEARRLGLALRPPNVNYAVNEFSVRFLEGQPVLFMGLNQVRELTRRTQLRIMLNRPYKSLLDFLARADPRPVEASNLARAGALEGFGAIPSLLRQLDSRGWRGGQLPLFELDASSDEDWSLEQKAAAQLAVLGVSIVAHPIELHAEAIASADALTTVEAAARLGERIRVAGMRQTWRRSRTASGDYIYFMALEDLEGMLEVVIYGEVYRRNRASLSGPGPYVLEGVVELDTVRGEPFIRADRVWKVTDALTNHEAP